MLTTSTLTSIFWPKENRLVKEFFLVLGAALFLSLASQISIPLKPVPLTFESITALFIGMALGARLGAYAIATYLATGALGLPVFAEFSGGLHVFMGPTAGYLIGFLPAAVLSGWLAQRGFAKSIFLSFIATALGTGVIFSFGILFLSKFFGMEKAILFGLKPFLISEPLKMIALAIFIPRLWEHG